MSIDITRLNELYSTLETNATRTLNKQFEKHNLREDQKAQVLSSAISTIIQVSSSSALQEQLNEAQIKIAEFEAQGKEYEVTNILPENLNKIKNESDLINTQENELVLNGTSRRSVEASQKAKLDKETDIATIAEYVAENTKADKVAMSGYSKLKTEAEKNVATGSVAHKINEAQYTAENINAQRLLTDERKTQLITSVTFNNYAKAVDSQSEWLAMYVGNGGELNDTMLLPMLEGVEALLTSDVNYTFSFSPDSVSI